MIRAWLLCVLAFFRASDADEVDFQDTPLLTSIWQATNGADNDAIDRLFDSSSFAVSSRSSDGRGPAWWAFEYKNTYALAAMLAYGGDPMSADEDLQGQTAAEMCEESAGCNKDELMETAKGMVDDIKKRKEEREKAAEADDDPDFDSDDADSGSSGGDDAGFDDDEF
mmetsp:Transcript_24749/g.43304  ORF Transcript_24749/g.43304 Transcript_24749/m.43304 type:complete len:168 (-) Transcript_24749:50-553(-)